MPYFDGVNAAIAWKDNKLIKLSLEDFLDYVESIAEINGRDWAKNWVEANANAGASKNRIGSPELSGKKEPGGRNDWLYLVGRNMFDDLEEKDEVSKKLHAFNNERAWLKEYPSFKKEPLNHKDIERIVDSIFSKKRENCRISHSSLLATFGVLYVEA